MRTSCWQFVAKIVQAGPGRRERDGFTAAAAAAVTNTGRMFVSLKPLNQRKGVSADQVIARLRGKLAKVPGASLFLQPVQDLRIGGAAATRSTSTPCRATTRRS
jgi:multidrug efflux pump